MDLKEILYVAFATLLVMVVLQVVTFLTTRMMYPPEPKIVYRDVPHYIQSPTPPPPEHVPLFPPPPPAQKQNGLAFTQPQQDIQLPEYEPRNPASTSLRLDTELPDGLQETRPPGT